MVIAWARVMDTLRLLYKGTQEGALWPAIRDWLAENDNLQGLWGGLAQCSDAGNATDILVVHDLVCMTHASLSQGRLPPTLLQHAHFAEALGRALGSILPADFSRGHGVNPSRRVIEINETLLKIQYMATAEPQLWQHLHLPALSLWPYLVGAIRRQREAGASNKDLQVSGTGCYRRDNNVINVITSIMGHGWMQCMVQSWGMHWLRTALLHPTCLCYQS